MKVTGGDIGGRAGAPASAIYLPKRVSCRCIAKGLLQESLLTWQCPQPGGPLGFRHGVLRAAAATDGRTAGTDQLQVTALKAKRPHHDI